MNNLTASRRKLRRKQMNKRRLNLFLAGLFAGGVLLMGLMGPSVEAASTRKKLQTGILKIFNDVDIATGTAASWTSDTIDLSGGQLDVCDFQVSVTSGATPAAASSVTLDFAVQTSADGGTTWAQTDWFDQIVSSETVIESTNSAVNVSPGNKARVLATMTANTTFYSVDMWAICKSD